MVSSNSRKTFFQKSDVFYVVTVQKCHCCIVELCKSLFLILVDDFKGRQCSMCGFMMGVLEIVYGRGPCVLNASLSQRVGVEEES